MVIHIEINRFVSYFVYKKIFLWKFLAVLKVHQNLENELKLKPKFFFSSNSLAIV